MREVVQFPVFQPDARARASRASASRPGKRQKLGGREGEFLDLKCADHELESYVQCPQRHTFILYMLYSISSAAPNTFLYFISFKAPHFLETATIFGKFG